VPTKLGILVLTALLAGCTLGPNFEPPSPKAPASWLNGAPSSAATPAVASLPVAEPIEADWWNAFGDPELTSLVTRAAAANLDIQAAAARVAESRAQLRVTGASQYPDINGNASYTREYQSPKGVIGLFGGSASSTPATGTNGLGGTRGGIPEGLLGPNGLPPFDLFQYGFDASWEVDLWGRVRRMVENAGATAEAQAYASRDAALSTVAEVARDYMQLRGTQETLRITHDNLANEQRSVDLTAERARKGFVQDLDVENARSQAASTAAQIPQLEQQQAQLINALGLLVGELPRALEEELAPARAVPPPPPRVPVGLPSELLQRRPDIREAEAQLHAATASIGAAKADFFPKITLSGSFAIQATQFKNLASWDAKSYSVGPAISLPIFDGGQLAGALALREAEQREAAAIYQKTVLSAFRDVDDALTAYAAEQRRRDQLGIAAAASRKALDLANTRYLRGLTGYLDVLTAERSLLTAEQSLADSTATVATDLVALYKALGGGWDVADNSPRPDGERERPAGFAAGG
jgi:NodT family efflux transporter outer membrane factor (OMF) lipoprotein